MRFGRRDQEPAKDGLPTPTSFYQWREVLRCRKCNLSPNSAACECQWNRTSTERPIAMLALPALWTHAAKLLLRTPVRRVWVHATLRWLLYPAGTAPVLWLRGKPHGKLPGLCEVGRAESRASKAGARSWPKEHRHSPPYRSERTAGRTLYRADRPGREVESRRSKGACCQGHYPPTPIPNFPSQPVTEASEKPKVTATRKTARPQKS
jgi:hypothetical protein